MKKTMNEKLANAIENSIQQKIKRGMSEKNAAICVFSFCDGFTEDRRERGLELTKDLEDNKT